MSATASLLNDALYLKKDEDYSGHGKRMKQKSCIEEISNSCNPHSLSPYIQHDLVDIDQRRLALVALSVKIDSLFFKIDGLF